MLLSIFPLTASLLILGWSAMSLLLWAHGKPHLLPWDRDDDAEVCLAKAGLDAGYGGLPLLLVFFLDAGALDPTGMPSPEALVAAGLTTFAYVAIYALLIRARMVRFRLRLRASARTAG